MLHLTRSYLSFILRSTNQHGVHSPFVYNLVTRCIYDRKKYPSYSILKKYRKSLLKDERKISIKDFGAGSRVFKSDVREVSKMAKMAGISPKRARLLNRLVRYLKVDTALELGTSLGLGTAAMAAGNKVIVTSIEGCMETAAIAKEKFENFGFNRVELKVGEFEEFLVDGGERYAVRTNSRIQIPDSNFTQSKNPQPTTDNPQPIAHNGKFPTSGYDLIYIDGNHQKEPTLVYFEKLLQAVHNDSVMIFDDIHWSKGMEEAWEEIKKHPKVRVTVDTFQWGLVFFRREQEKEHFVIRI